MMPNRSTVSLVSFVLVVAVLASPASSQPGPRIRAGDPDACRGASSSYWVDSLHDALADRAAFLCACRADASDARITMALDVRPPGVIGSCEPSDAVNVTPDAASCFAHRANAVVHTWLASFAPRLRPPIGDTSRPSSTVFDFAPIVCPAAGGTDAHSALSRAYLENHPNGLRIGVTIPRPECRSAIAASLRVPFSW